MQQYGVIFIDGCDTIEHLGSQVLINICHYQLLQPLVRLFPIPKHLRNHLLFCIPYLVVRRLIAIIFRLYHKFEMLNWGSVILT